MKLDPILTKATRFARRRNYQGAIKTLEAEVNRYHGSFRYYYLLAVSCLYVNDYQGALTYFKLARDVKIRDPQVLLGMAVLYLRRGETDRAVDFYLEVQELDVKNRIAARALKIIRKYAGRDNISAWLESGDLPRLYPPLPPLPFSVDRLVKPAAAVFGAALAASLILALAGVIPVPGSRGKRPVISGSALEKADREKPVEVGGAYQYILTQNQVLETYEKAFSLFTAYRDDAARIELNRLIESNASEGIKNKCRLLISSMEVPGFDTYNMRDNPAYADVIKEPVLYRDSHGIWRGMATNVEAIPNRTSFDLLVGYDTKKVLEGIVRVEFKEALALNSEKPLEVLGRIVPVSVDTGIDIRIEGVAIHQTGILEQK
jgi:tetratricopeptide (TPR) repeat protein